jgi:hypothetical protein
MKDLPDFSKIINKELLDNLTFDEAKYIWRLKELIEKKFKQEKIKMTLWPLSKKCGQSLLKVDTIKKLQKNLMTLPMAKLKD